MKLNVKLLVPSSNTDHLLCAWPCSGQWGSKSQSCGQASCLLGTGHFFRGIECQGVTRAINKKEETKDNPNAHPQVNRQIDYSISIQLEVDSIIKGMSHRYTQGFPGGSDG